MQDFFQQPLLQGVSRHVSRYLTAAVTGVWSALVPFCIGLLLGERPALLAIGGVVIVTIEIALVSGSADNQVKRSSLKRDRHQPFAVYKLSGQTYQLQIGEPFWMPAVDIDIGHSRRILGGIGQEVLLWFDADGTAYPIPDEIIESTEAELIAERQKAQADKQRADQLADYVRSLGVDPDHLPSS